MPTKQPRPKTATPANKKQSPANLPTNASQPGPERADGKGRRSLDLLEMVNEYADREYDQRIEEIRQRIDDADYRVLARELVEWLSPRTVTREWGDVLPVTCHGELRCLLTDVLTVGMCRPLKGGYDEEPAEALTMLMDAVDLVWGRDTVVSEDSFIECPDLFSLELERNAGNLDAIRKPLGLLAGSTASSCEKPGTAGTRGNAGQAQEQQATQEVWKRANKAADIANKITGETRDWSLHWRYWCLVKHQGEVKTRPARTRGGEPSERGLEIEMGSFYRALDAHAGDFVKLAPEDKKLQDDIRIRILAARRNDLEDNIQAIADGTD